MPHEAVIICLSNKPTEPARRERHCHRAVLIDAIRSQTIITKEETFGPVAPLYRFKTDDEAIKMATF
jgi:acyl-CoA reductase-like NAD-dependent aldehyde dehydrogenase